MQPLIRKIILATDFSEASQDAVRYAVWMVKSLQAELKLLHVFEPSGWFHLLIISCLDSRNGWMPASKRRVRMERNRLKDWRSRWTCKWKPFS
ncbi:MAG: universal stress protein [Nitrosospira sp.]|nr:universal stress protein [Nitrosospira sp.]